MNFEGNRHGRDEGGSSGEREDSRGRNRDDERIRAGFEALRMADESEAPPFERIWDAAWARSVRRRNRRLAAAAVIVFLAAGTGLFLGRRGPRMGPSGEGSITEWRSPTAALLVYAGGGLSTAGPGGAAGSVAGTPTATTRLVSDWSSPTASLLRPPGGGAGRGGTSSSTETERRES